MAADLFNLFRQNNTRFTLLKTALVDQIDKYIIIAWCKVQRVRLI